MYCSSVREITMLTRAFHYHSLVVLAIALCLLEGVSATRFSYNDDVKCQSPASVSVSSLSCGEESSSCGFGEDLKASGELELSEDMPESVCAELKSCFMGVSFVCKTYKQDNLNLCEELRLSGDGSECPAAGTYTFETDMKIPGSDETMSLGSGWWVKTTVSLKDCDSGSEFTTCTATFKAVSSGSSGSAAAAFLNISAIGLVAALGFVYHRRRSRLAQIDLGREELLADSKQENIEMMCGQQKFVQV